MDPNLNEPYWLMVIPPLLFLLVWWLMVVRRYIRISVLRLTWLYVIPAALTSLMLLPFRPEFFNPQEWTAYSLMIGSFAGMSVGFVGLTISAEEKNPSRLARAAARFLKRRFVEPRPE